MEDAGGDALEEAARRRVRKARETQTFNSDEVEESDRCARHHREALSGEDQRVAPSSGDEGVRDDLQGALLVWG